MTIWIVLILLAGSGSGFYLISRLICTRRCSGGETGLDVSHVVLGTMMSLVTVILLLIALWPPIEPLTLYIPFGILGLLAGLIYFIRDSHPKVIELWELLTKSG